MQSDGPPREAFRRAVDCIHRGRFDNRTPEGAQANALESIAWSLLALISKDTLLDDEGRSAVRQAVNEIGLLRYEEMQ